MRKCNTKVLIQVQNEKNLSRFGKILVCSIMPYCSLTLTIYVTCEFDTWEMLEHYIPSSNSMSISPSSPSPSVLVACISVYKMKNKLIITRSI